MPLVNPPLLDPEHNPEGKDWVAWSLHPYYPSVSYHGAEKEAKAWCDKELESLYSKSGEHLASVGYGRVIWAYKFRSDH